ncbi:hypothetical protein ACFSGX_12520 [Sphingomonas arantia]|uniref:Uncharacterized protein n=1 Tax=Sphingomonas arantia TaxID=1460676 RepID=A0ABW4TXY1_9SPHN
MSIIGWKLYPSERERLLVSIRPTWPDVVADHVTLDASAKDASALPTQREGVIVGSIDDGNGLQALVVSINGTTRRPDGNTFHITWSLDRSKGRRANESNALLSSRIFEPLKDPIVIHLFPAYI